MLGVKGKGALEEVGKLQEPCRSKELKLKHDGVLTLATGRSRRELEENQKCSGQVSRRLHYYKNP